MNFLCMSRFPNSCRLRIIKLIVRPLYVLKYYWKLRYSCNKGQVLKQIFRNLIFENRFHMLAVVKRTLLRKFSLWTVLHNRVVSQVGTRCAHPSNLQCKHFFDTETRNIKDWHIYTKMRICPSCLIIIFFSVLELKRKEVPRPTILDHPKSEIRKASNKY